MTISRDRADLVEQSVGSDPVHAFTDLVHEERDPDYCAHFGFSRVTTGDGDRSDMIATLATRVAANKADPAVTADLIAAAGWEVAGATLRSGRASVTRGDFGEVVAAEAIEAFDNLVVPVRKLRYQIDPNQTLPGTDVVAFDINEEREITGLHLAESKYREKPGRSVLVEAIDQLEADRTRKFATTINFLAHRLREDGSPLYQEFIDYLTDTGERNDTYSVCLTCDTEEWNGIPLEEAAALGETLKPLLIRVVTIEDANDLIDSIVAQMGSALS